MGLVSCDSETFDSISNKLSVRNLQGSLLTISLVLATHVPRILTTMFRRESLVEISHYRIRGFPGGCDIDVHVDHQHRYNLVIHHQSKYAWVYQALLKTTLNQG